jgi:3-deoxy-7-phosphoheptulonate synthase
MTLAAVAGGCDGIMIDVHPHPEQARCDGPQALLPDELAALAERMWQLAAWMGRDVPASVASVGHDLG